ncbi:DUF1931 family protein [Lentzea aerocolonigenes]|uniref:DUF1931 family protein n=1 Tax=Lentzea aerocolonigenes TaxID=68170 RepID=UPI0004C3258B|nr:DUF1931 family protein [Lentzea aerocolonigenes]MCP2242400.1 protein of unknown function (DUF1931) [Lentzea aerocolonigenes]
MPVMNVTRFEHFFRTAAGLDVDKEDLKRYNEFVDRNLADLYLMAGVTAKTNGRDVLQPYDFPITKGLQELVREFEKLFPELEDVLDEMTSRPPDVVLSDEAEAWVPRVAGGVSLGLARTFKIIEPDLVNPRTRHWDTAFRLFDLLL